MPTDVTSTIASPGGDFTTTALWAASIGDIVTADQRHIGLHRRSSDTSGVTVNVSTQITDATRNMILRGEGGRRSLFDPAKLGSLNSRISNTSVFFDVEDMALFATSSTNAYGLSGSAAVTCTIRRCWIHGDSAATVRGAYSINSNAATVLRVEACYIQDVDGVTAAAGARSEGAGTVQVVNCTIWGCRNGVERVTGTVTTQNVYASREPTGAGAAYAGTIGDTTSCSDDGSNSTTQITEAAFARVIARLPSLRFYNDFTSASYSGAHPRDARVALMRLSGTIFGSRGGDCASTAYGITGTTGGLSFAENICRGYVASVAGMVRITMPAAPASRGLFQWKARGDDFNRLGLYIDAAGKLVLAVYDNAGAVTLFEWTPPADNLAGTHDIGFRLHSGTVTLYLDGSALTLDGSSAYAGTRDSSDVLAMTFGAGAAFFLGVNGSLALAGITTGAAAPPALPLEPYADNAGYFDLWAPSPLSAATVKNGGTAAGAPTRGIDGLPLADRRRFDETAGHAIGAVGYHPTATPGGDKWGAGLISGDVVALPGPVYP